MTTYTFYRGDTRSNTILAKAGGFTAWVPLSLPQARSVVTRCDGATTADVVLPIAAHRIIKQLNTQKKIKLLDLTRYVKVIKDHTSIQISTDLTEECGGYASGNIYKIEYDDLYVRDSTAAVATQNPVTLEVTSHFGAMIITDAALLANANVVGITSKGNEVYFLTSIPAAKITKYKASPAARCSFSTAAGVRTVA